MNPESSALKFAPTAENIVLFCVKHLGVVKSVADPKKLGRVRVMVPGLAYKGKKNWSEWLFVGGTRVGDNKTGDMGDWWPIQPGQNVWVFFAAGDPEVRALFVGFPCADGGTPLIPAELKMQKNPRDVTRIPLRKTPAGHTLLFSDCGKREKAALMDWAGAGLFISCPGKQEDEKEQEDEESKPRKGECRGTRMVVTKTSKKPGELMRDGTYLLGLFDLNGSGIIKYATNDQGIVAGFARTSDGKIGASWLADAKNQRLFLTAGPMQIQVLGKENKIAVTRQIIMEVEKIDVESVIDAMAGALGKEFEEFSGG